MTGSTVLRKNSRSVSSGTAVKAIGWVNVELLLL
jgi:hypothetical protein